MHRLQLCLPRAPTARKSQMRNSADSRLSYTNGYIQTCNIDMCMYIKFERYIPSRVYQHAAVDATMHL